MLTNSAKAAGSPAGSGMKATEANQVQQANSAPAPRYAARNRKQTVRYGHEESASSSGSQELGDEDEETSVPNGPVVTWQNGGILDCRFTNASSMEKLRALLAQPPRRVAGSSGSTNGNSKRRKAPLSNALDLDESEPDTKSAENPPKRRRQTGKERAEQRAIAATVQESFPEPRGQPEVWADDRQSLCEALPYFQAFKSGVYVFNGYGYGWLLDNDNDERGYMDDEIVISRFGGSYGQNEKTGKMEPEKHQTLSEPNVQSFINNMREHVPVNIIIGSKNAHAPSKMPHRYNVGGSDMVNCIWSEKVTGKNVSRIRLQKINLREPGWYAAKDSPLPPADRDYTTKAPCDTCISCKHSWPQIYQAGWICLNDGCEEHFIIDGEICTNLTYNPIWWNERTEWNDYIVPPFPLKPSPPISDSNVASLDQETSLSCWKGMVCPKCGRCNARTKWDEWKCLNEACDFELPVKHTVFPPSSLIEKRGFEFEGQAISYDKFEAPVTKRETEWPGYWRQSTYDIPGGNVVSHFHANAATNRQPRGANDMLEVLQGSKLGLERFKMGNASADGLSLVSHFAMNYGMPYKYVVSVKSKGFSEAPSTMIDVVNRLTWAGKRIVNDGTYKQFNELLCLGYFEDQKIGYHDDGEKDLGPTIVSISIGGEAVMSIRMKAKFYFCLKHLTQGNYDPLAEIELGTHLYKERLELTELFKKAQQQEEDGDDEHEETYQAYQAAKAKFFTQLKADEKKKTAPTILTLNLKHGDIVVMHGHDLQARYEHSVQPKGKLRYGLTCRHIKPENIPEAEHWKGEFHIKAEDVYDGGAGPVVAGGAGSGR